MAVRVVVTEEVGLGEEREEGSGLKAKESDQIKSEQK